MDPITPHDVPDHGRRVVYKGDEANNVMDLATVVIEPPGEFRRIRSEWRPDEGEKRALAAGGTVVLDVYSRHLSPVSLSVRPLLDKVETSCGCQWALFRGGEHDGRTVALLSACGQHTDAVLALLGDDGPK